MQRLIISGFSVLLVIAATAPAFAYGKVKESNTRDSQFIPATSSMQPLAPESMTTQSNKREPQSRSSTSPLIDPNPPAEVPSPSLIWFGLPFNLSVNPADAPSSRLAAGAPGAPILETPEANSKNLMPEEPSVDPDVTNVRGILGTPFNPAVNPAEDLGSRLAASTPGAPTTKNKML